MADLLGDRPEAGSGSDVGRPEEGLLEADLRMHDDRGRSHRPLEVIPGGLRIKETETHYIDVIEMIYSWRVVRTPKSCPESYDRGYCYFGFKEGGSKATALFVAVLAAYAWDGADDTDPEAFDKKLPL